MPRYTGTIAVSPNPVPFGSTAAIAFSADFDKPWARITCLDPEAGSVLMVSYPRLWNGEATFVAGPTPSWPSGPAKGVAELLKWNTKTARFVSVASTTFDVR